MLRNEPPQHRNEIRDTAGRDGNGPEHNDDRRGDQAGRSEIRPGVKGELTVQRDDDRSGIGGADQVTAGETGRIAESHLAAGRPLLRLSGVGHGTKVAR